MLKVCLKIIWILIFSLSVCELYAQTEQKAETDTHYEDFEEFVNVIKEIQNKYVNEVGLKDLLKNAYRGMLSGLDPYSQFIDSEGLEELKIETEGKFDGLGIEVIIKDGILTVLTPIVDSPAFKAGILIGDKIISINGESTRNISISETVDLLRGKPNTEVTLTVVHEGESEPVNITVKRAKVQVKSIRGTRIVDEECKIGYIAVNSFQENTITDMDSAIQDLEKQGVEALILDLRFNPGGLLNIARDMTDKFIKKGVIVSTKGRHKSQNHEYKAHRIGTYPDYPLAVLVNRGSASASEIVAGAIKDHKRGVLIGTRTFGKGSVQALIPIENKNSALKLTTARYYTPSGTLIEESGIEPDIEIDLEKGKLKELYTHLSRIYATDILTENKKETLKDSNSKDKNGFVDIQLAKAIDVLKGISSTSK